MQSFSKPLKGRGAQLITANPYNRLSYDNQSFEGIDEPMEVQKETQVFFEHAKKIINKVTSPDIPLEYSMNPYQGCEHGCIYCYARNTHHYWGYSAGLDFESKIIVKKNAAQLLEKEISAKGWKAAPIMFSGNTDCYQPLERQYEITRSCLQIFLKYKHPVGIITKNSMVLRDLDILQELAALDLVHVFISITTLDNELRSAMEPRTATSEKRLQVIKTLAGHKIPVGVMAAPIIPGMNNHELPAILQAAADNGAGACGYSLVRLNGPIEDLFKDWIRLHYADRSDKVLNQIKECHEGKLGDSRVGARMRGSGTLADSIRQLYQMAKRKYFQGKQLPAYNLLAYNKNAGGQLSLF